MDFEAIKKAAQAYGPDMTRFLRDMIAIPSESCEEKGVAHRIAEEMKKLGYDKVEFDALGNVIGWATRSSPSTPTSTPSASATAKTGRTTRTRATRMTRSSTAAAAATRRAAWLRRPTARRS